MILFFCERHESCALFQNIIFLNIYNAKEAWGGFYREKNPQL